jgi:hypothetical protein
VKVKMGDLLNEFEQSYTLFLEVYFESWRDYKGNEPWNDTEEKAYERWKKTLRLRYDHLIRLSSSICSIKVYKFEIYERIIHTTERATLLYLFHK